MEDQFLKGEVGKSSIKLDFEYYILYSQFLQIDRESLISGRNYELVFCFLLYYRALLNKKQYSKNRSKNNQCYALSRKITRENTL